MSGSALCCNVTDSRHRPGQGKLVADVASAAGVEHLVYASAGTGEAGTGLAHFDSRIEVDAHMRDLDLPVTVVRPGPFMELMTQKDFFPALGRRGAPVRRLGHAQAVGLCP